MYPKEGPEWNLSPIRDVVNPDLEKYPLFAEARCTTFVLEPGEMLFVPSRWWHTAKMLTESVTLSINTLNKSNWANFCEDMTRRASAPAKLVKKAYLALERARFGLLK
jgi:ribosomal protein L16 Arg81 hydroxylase